MRRVVKPTALSINGILSVRFRVCDLSTTISKSQTLSIASRFFRIEKVIPLHARKAICSFFVRATVVTDVRFAIQTFCRIFCHAGLRGKTQFLAPVAGSFEMRFTGATIIRYGNAKIILSITYNFERIINLNDWFVHVFTGRRWMRRWRRRRWQRRRWRRWRRWWIDFAPHKVVRSVFVLVPMIRRDPKNIVPISWLMPCFLTLKTILITPPAIASSISLCERSIFYFEPAIFVLVRMF